MATDVFLMGQPAVHRMAGHAKDGGLTVTLYYRELEYDVRYALWKHGQMAGAQGEAIYLYEIEEDEGDWLLRQLSSAVESMRGKLAWTLAEEGSDAVTDALSGTPESWTFRFKPGSRWESPAAGLADAMHTYVVDAVLAAWFKTGNMNVSTAYAAMAEAVLGSLRTKTPVKRRRPPYLRPDMVVVDDTEETREEVTVS